MSISWIAWIERTVLLLAVVYFGLHTLPRAWAALNTDFPNYYLAAKMAREGIDTARMYEWTWIERQKDLHGIDVRVIGLLPITPFSTLFVLPLTFFKALTAKRVWIVVNLLLLVPLAAMLRRLTGLSLTRIGLALFLSFPLYRNILYGQFYIVLLFLLVAACGCYLRGRRSTAAALVAVAGMCKVFPLLLFVLFVRRREWRALLVGVFTAALGTGLAVMVFGLEAHRVWLAEILPWVMRGEGLGTYSATASFSSVLHVLLLDEPQWNPLPWHASIAGYAVGVGVLPTLVLAGGVLLIRPEDESRERLLVEWATLVTVALAISTIPASYNFVLMIFPACVLAGLLIERRRHAWLAMLVVAFLGIGYPLPTPEHAQALHVLRYVARLPLMLCMAGALFAVQWRGLPPVETRRDWTRYAWAAAMVAYALLGIRSAWSTELGERKEYAFRLPPGAQGYANTSPLAMGDDVGYIRFGLVGYELVRQGEADSPDSREDVLSFTNAGSTVLAERIRALTPEGAAANVSQVVDMSGASRVIAEGVREPMLSQDGRSLALVRDDRGRGRLMLRKDLGSSVDEIAVTPAAWNVYEASFMSDDAYVVAASEGGGSPRIFMRDAAHGLSIVAMPESRYPALSPDGRWLAFSHREHGFWNLWLRDQNSGALRRIAEEPCNQMQASWERDSKTLLYASDCGRSLWFTAVSRRKVVP